MDFAGVLLLFFSFAPKNVQEILPATPLPVKEVIVFEDLDLFPKQVFPFNEEYLLFPELRTNTIRLFHLPTKQVQEFLLPGEGPTDVNGGFFWLTEFQGKILIQEINTMRLKLFDLNKKVEVVTMLPKPMAGAAAVGKEGKQGVVHILEPTTQFFDGEEMQAGTGDSMFLYQIGEDGTWSLQGEFRYFESMGNELADTFFHGKVKVFPIVGSDEFFLVPLWGAPEIVVLNTSGQTVQELPFPHPWAGRMPKDPAMRLQLYQERLSRSSLGAAATSDGNGNLYILLDNLFWTEKDVVQNYSGRVIIQMNRKGEITQSFITQTPLHTIFMIPNSNQMYALDLERERLLKLGL